MISLRQLDKQWRRQEFRGRQLGLAAAACPWLIAGVFVHDAWLLLAVLLIQTGSGEALRFRRSGHYHQTRRSIWRGSTPHDARQRHLLQGWRPR